MGTYSYCKRAWWFQSQGLRSANQAELAAGTEYHRQHGRGVLVAGAMRLAGWVILMIAVVVFAVGLTLLWLK